MTSLVLPDGLVGLLRGRDPLVGIVERFARHMAHRATGEAVPGLSVARGFRADVAGRTTELAFVLSAPGELCGVSESVQALGIER